MTGAAQTARAGRHAGERVGVRWLWRYLRPFRTTLIASVVLAPTITAIHLIQPYLLKVGIDDYIAASRFSELYQLASLLVGLVVVEYVLRYVQHAALHRVGQRAVHAVRTDLYQHVLRLRADFFAREQVGSLTTGLTSDCEAIADAICGGASDIIADALLAIGIVIAMFVVDAQLAVIALITAPALFLAAGIFRRLLHRAYLHAQSKNLVVAGYLHEHLSGIKVVQAFRRERESVAGLVQRNDDHRASQARIVVWDVLLYSSVEALASIAIAGLIWLGGRRIFQGTLTFGALVAMIEYLNRFYMPVRDLSSRFGVMGRATAAAARLGALRGHGELDAVVDASAVQRERDTAPVVALKHVSFAYRPDRPVLRDIDLRVEHGRSIAIVGRTGSGKTSLVRLLTRLYEPRAGEIEFHGRALRSFSREELRTRMILVPQEVCLFHGTLRDNLTLWDRTIPDERIAQVSSRLGLHDVFRRRGSALDATVDERGANFSAGERQLIAFARTLLRDPEVLLLDEVTANVDPDTERLVAAGMQQMTSGRTSIVIAHRLATVERADMIVVLEDGAIVEMGTHSELLARAGRYGNLLRIDHQGMLDLR